MYFGHEKYGTKLIMVWIIRAKRLKKLKKKENKKS